MNQLFFAHPHRRSTKNLRLHYGLDGMKYIIQMYEGEYNDGNCDGQGTSTTSNGDKYEGEWKDGEWNGQGIFTISDGTKYVGEFKDGTDWNTTGYDKDGNIIGRYVNGTEQ